MEVGKLSYHYFLSVKDDNIKKIQLFWVGRNDSGGIYAGAEWVDKTSENEDKKMKLSSTVER